MIADAKQDIKEKIKGKVLYDEPMRRHTSFRIGGPADIWVEPKDITDLKNCIKISKEKNIPLFIIGGGTNLLVSDEGIRGIVINMFTPTFKKIFWGNRKVDVTSSVPLREFLNFCCNKGLGGLEFLAGIPGSVGGATMTNAASRHYGNIEKWHNIGDFINAIKILNYNGAIKLLSKREFTFNYKSLNLENCIILEVKFLLERAKREEVLNEYQKFLKRKKETQDLSAPSAGCIFKNPKDTHKSAGQLIDECGLKGMRIGDAAISGKHANFIINRSRATSSDVMALIDMAKKRVKNKFGIDLFLEIKIV